MNDLYSFYILGRKEGYFNVRLETSVLSKGSEIAKVFFKGHQLGQQIRQNELINEDEAATRIYNAQRNAYIASMGYKAALEGRFIIPRLSAEDKIVYENGYKAAKACKLIERTAINELNEYKKQMTLVRDE